MPAQAQKHVTVNEALARLDAVAQLRVVSSDEPTPPLQAADGESYLVPSGASGEWETRIGHIATWSNGGWVYGIPKAGWRAWDERLATSLTFDGSDWLSDALAVTPGGAALLWKLREFDHQLAPGASSETAAVIPAGVLVIGVSGRVLEEFKGVGISGWSVGVPGAPGRYGAGLGLNRNSYVMGLSGTPVAYYSASPLLLQAQGGDFTGGKVRLCVYYAQLRPPRPV
jgi:hypothetical protein